MQRTITDILTEWFYRLPNGYAIQPYNKIELQVLSKILAENNIDPTPIIETLDQGFLDAKPVEEAPKPEKVKTSPAVATTNLHETFYAIALAYIIEIGAESVAAPDIKTLEDFYDISNYTAKTLKNAKETTDNAVNHLTYAVYTAADTAK